MKKYINRTIALAGIFQASALIKDLAWNGKCDPAAFNTCMYSLLKLNSASVLDVYENLSQLSIGLNNLNNFFNKKTAKDLEIIKYVFSLLYLEQKLSNRDDLLKIIEAGIIRANIQANIFSINHDNVIANFAGIYLDTLSTLNFRIKITGTELYLINHNITNKIRALLLAGIRSAVLWKQLGGSKLKLFFQQNTFAKCTLKLMHNIKIQEKVHEYS